MADGNEHIRELVRKRIAGIEDETKRLKKALVSLDGGGGPESARPAARPSRSQARRRPASKRAPRGQRLKQFLAAVEANPKASVEEIAKKVGVPLTQVRSVARRLEAQGAIKRSGQGFKVTAK